ncbi:metal-dependent hydrolase [Haloplanus halobius]|uniref:metal-dependent hydrolase n=1 Tax=Haloplanus halobius TaxID=2934938 RepID=UPI00200E4121|nr:metal-dependent hydrolase [Haloplanus sp. XH21]
MMATTHAAVGLVLALPLLVLAPDLAAVGALASLAGGVFPDLDLLAGQHRKTLHFPDYYWLGAVPALVAAAVAPSATTVAVAWFLLSAAVHSVSDAFGAGTEPRPWERTSAEAVYLHSRRRWIAPRYWVRYDGAPEDYLLTVLLLAPGLTHFGPTVGRVTLVLLTVGGAYTLVRKRLPDLEERLLK